MFEVIGLAGTPVVVVSEGAVFLGVGTIIPLPYTTAAFNRVKSNPQFASFTLPVNDHVHFFRFSSGSERCETIAFFAASITSLLPRHFHFDDVVLGFLLFLPKLNLNLLREPRFFRLTVFKSLFFVSSVTPDCFTVIRVSTVVVGT